MAQGSVKLWAAAALMALGACTAPASEPAPAAPTPPPPRPQQTAPATPAPPPRSSDSCGAGPLQYLVGRPRTDIPVPVNPSQRRVVCSTCMMTQDYVPSRQTITYDTQTGRVSSVRCG
jgi:hypothetical protein